MASEADPFELEYEGFKIRVQRHNVANTFVYHVVFQDKRPPLAITRATNANAARWWTSIPEGRQPEAEQIGPLIAEYIQKNEK
ncbi:MAG TPA: hypothetical protein VI461_10690 [Chitinophagaceae bacterium]|nr:hypothetical protein [Chitinophagaceae bacterium]